MHARIGNSVSTIPSGPLEAAPTAVITTHSPAPNGAQGRLIVAANRLPVVAQYSPAAGTQFIAASGGLVTALKPVLSAHRGMWIGWSGTVGEQPPDDVSLDQLRADLGFDMRCIALTEEEAQRFYLGFSNEIIWPLFHDLQSHCNFDPSYWQTYVQVNRKFAQAVYQAARPDDFVWVQDYHLMNVASELRKLGIASRVGFFLHIPFPSLDIFLKLPWRQSVIRSLLDYDVVGFQTLRDRRNFAQCLRALVKDVQIEGHGQVLTARSGQRETRIGHFPIGIDYAEFARGAVAPEVAKEAAQLREFLPDRQLILGIDRLDYTKGIVQRLTAFHKALGKYPELCGHVTLIQVVIPSREDIPMYHDLRTEVERTVGRINGEYTRPGGWVPIHYIYRSLSRVELLAYYRAASIGFVTPLKDGMNLVAKEYCTCSIEEDCVLILSEFAGAAPQLRGGALLVNPYDVEGVADTIHRAFHMGTDERKRRMRRLRRAIQRRDIYWWVEAFLRAAPPRPGALTNA